MCQALTYSRAMGGHPYWYHVPYRDDVQDALDELREREFRAGRYNPVMPFIEFGDGLLGQQPGPDHDSIHAAIEDAMEDGTRSILDIEHVGSHADYGVAAPLSASRLRELYGTERPTRAMVDDHRFFDEIERGKCVYLVVYEGDTPRELMFAGYSYD
jgi:hypothetical protein